MKSVKPVYQINSPCPISSKLTVTNRQSPIFSIFGFILSLVCETNSGTPNNTYLNNFDKFNKVLKNNFEINNLFVVYIVFGNKRFNLYLILLTVIRSKLEKDHLVYSWIVPLPTFLRLHIYVTTFYYLKRVTCLQLKKDL